MAFDQPTRNRLARFVGDARTLLTAEFTRQLQNDYGLDPERGTVTDLAKLTQLDDARRATARILRDTLTHYLAGDAAPTAKARQEALNRIVREQAFTVLNRLCALRMAEARGLLIESIAKGYQSRGFQLYSRLAGTALGETGDAYRAYLFSLFDEFGVDLAVLFDRFSPQGRLFPRPALLLELLALINNAEIDPLWAEDETIGWIYQYFNSKEERKAMRDASQAPRNSRELAVRNQFFTPRYVVEFLTDNTLGRIWYEMTQGQTGLVDSCRYLVRRPTEVFLRDPENPLAGLPLTEWVQLAARGDFSALPAAAEVPALSEFSLVIDGYALADRHGYGDCIAWADEQIARYRQSGVWPSSSLELWLILFRQQRYHGRADREPEAAFYAEWQSAYRAFRQQVQQGSAAALENAPPTSETIAEAAFSNAAPNMTDNPAALENAAPTVDNTAEVAFSNATPNMTDNPAALENAASTGETTAEAAFSNAAPPDNQAALENAAPTSETIAEAAFSNAASPVPEPTQEELLRQPVYIPFRPLKDPRTILMLDPACGSMHFGLYSFDLYERIYEEAWALEGELGAHAFQRPAAMAPLRESYADKASFLRDVPRLIIEHNIHGIDIDPRAVQIAGLSLWLRAQRSWQAQGIKPHDRPVIRKANIVCAEPMPGDQALLEEFLQGLRDDRLEALIRRVLAVPENQRVRATPTMADALCDLVRTVWEEMKLAGEAGSLLKIEESLTEAIAKGQAEWEDKMPLFRVETFRMTEEKPKVNYVKMIPGEESDFWARAETLVFAALEEYAEKTEDGAGYQRRLFANDAAQGFALIDLCHKKYDSVLMNPPFGDFTKEAKSWVVDVYPLTKNDIYAAFVECGIKRLHRRAMLGAITSRTGFFLSSFQKWREEVLLRDAPPTVFADLGNGVLDNAMVEVAAYCLEAAA